MRKAPTESMLRWSAALCLLVGILLWLGPWILRPDLFTGDATHHVFWLYRYADPLLFPGDLSIEYFSSHSVAPMGYRAIYAALAPWVDVLLAAEWISILLLGASALLAWQLGRVLATQDRELTGLFSVVALLLLLPVIDLHPALGLQRTFALPFTLLCLWALASGRYRLVGISWVGAALVYPVIIPVLGLTAVIVFLVELVRERRMPANWLWNGALGVLAILIVWLGSGTPDGVGPMVTYEQARLMPEFGPGGRQRLFGASLSGNWFWGHRTGLGWSPWAVVAVAAALAVIYWRNRLRLVPLAAWTLTATGIVLWFLARLVLFDLYLPNRHSRWSLAAFAIIVFALAGYSLVTWILRVGKAGESLDPARRRAIAWAAPVLVAGVLAPSAHAVLMRPVDTDLERAYRFLESLPRDTLVVAHPDLANSVPLRSKRSVLASTEGGIAFMLGYYGRFRPRIEASLRAAYATSWQELDAILGKTGPCVVLTDASVWTKERYDAGFEDLLRELFKRGAKDGFVLKSPPPDRVLFESGDVYVVRCPGDRDVKAVNR